MSKNETLTDVIERRGRANGAVIKALNHLPRDHALNIILSYIPISRLEEALPTIKGSEPPVLDPVEAFAHRVKIACIQRGIEPLFIHARDGRKGRKVRTSAEIDRLLKEAVAEALS